MTSQPILIVDDNPINLKLAKLLLTGEGYEVRTAVNSDDVLKVLESFQPRLILMDLQLPGKNGLELTKELKSDPKYQDIIIVALTAYAMKGDEEKAKAAGCDGYMTKPISVLNFPIEIAKYFVEKTITVQKTEEINKSTSPTAREKKSEKSNSVLKEDNKSKKNILIIEDNPVSCKVLKLSLESENYIVSKAMNATEGLTLASKQKFDLIIQDIYLPDMDGYALNKKLRAIPEIMDIPIIGLSGFLNRSDELDNHKGFTTFLLKPVEPSYLLDVVRTYLPDSTLTRSSLGKGKYILIADDNPIQLKLFSIKLKNYGFEVTVAFDGALALKEAMHRKPDAIISDILMPNLDGFGLCLEIKNNPELTDIPVILLTSHYLDDADLVLAKNVGASCYLTRTPDEEKLISELMKVLNEKERKPSDMQFELKKDIKEQHLIRSVRQLEQQVIDNAKLANRYAMLLSQLSLISGIANALATSKEDINDSLKEALYFCLDATGVSKGALYIRKFNKGLMLSQLLGYSEDMRGKAELFFGLSSQIAEIIANKKPFIIPGEQFNIHRAMNFLKEASVKCAIFVPLFSGDECIGLLFLGSDLTNLSSINTKEFINTLGIQFGQSIALAEAFEKIDSSEKRYRQLVEISPDAILIQQEGVFVYANKAALSLLKAESIENLLAFSFYDFFTPDYKKVIANYIQHNKSTEAITLKDGKVINLMKETLDVEIVVSPFQFQEKEAVYIIMRDITQRKRSALQLEIQYAIAWILAESATLFVATAKILKIICERLQWDFGTIWAVDKEANVLRCTRVWQMPDIQIDSFQKKCENITFAPGTELPGVVWRDRKAIWISDLVQKDNFERKSASAEIGLNSGVAFPIIYEDEVLGVIEFFSKNIRPPDYDLLLWFESIGNQFGLFLMRKHMEKEMLYLAEHDVLTGLSNRVLLEQYLNTAIINAENNDHKLAILFLDLDHFKYINDSMGHEAGDHLLREVSERFNTCLRPQDTISRLGGDEFIIIIPKIHRKEDVIEIIVRLQNQLSCVFSLNDKEFSISASIGISMYPEDGKTVQSLIKGADIAMYAAKENGRNNFQFCTPEMTIKAENRGVLQNNLRKALDNDEFLLYYQPKIDVLTKKVTGMEALIRWKRDDGILLPGSFISDAEDSDLIVPIGEWVLKTAAMQNQAWQMAGFPTITISINLSVRNLNKELLRVVKRILKTTNLQPNSIEIELTESALMENVENNIQILRKLKEMGLLLSIDDFGTGYSSLSYLKRFPIDTIKIDQSFVRDIATDPGDAAIVIAIIAMAKSLSFKVIAEGVETIDQLKFLCEHGCDEIQGYYFSRPLSVFDATNFLKNSNIDWSFD